MTQRARPTTDTKARPLVGVCVVVTRAADKAARLSEPLTALGAEVIEVPATRVELLDAAPVMAALKTLAAYDWLIFTSQYAVAFFWKLWLEAGQGAAALATVKVVAVGPATASAVEALGIHVEVTPRRFVAEGLLDALRERDDVRGRRMLYLVAWGAREVLPVGLRAMGATVDVIPLYRSVADVGDANGLRDRLLRGEVDLVTFTAASAARAFVEAVGADAAGRVGIVSMGPATSAAVRAMGLEVRAEADPSTLDALVQATVAARR